MIRRLEDSDSKIVICLESIHEDSGDSEVHENSDGEVES